MLGDHPVDVMLLATDLDLARRFYAGTVGLEVLPVSDPNWIASLRRQDTCHLDLGWRCQAPRLSGSRSTDDVFGRCFLNVLPGAAAGCRGLAGAGGRGLRPVVDTARP
jgi:hypothetical protein